MGLQEEEAWDFIPEENIVGEIKYFKTDFK